MDELCKNIRKQIVEELKNLENSADIESYNKKWVELKTFDRQCFEYF